MSRQLEQQIEERTAKRHANIVRAVEYALQGGVERSGGEYLGFSYKHSPGEGLLVIRAVFPAGLQVAFVGSEDLGGCLVKAVNLANRDGLRWRADKYVGQS